MNSQTKTEHVITRKVKVKSKNKEGFLHELNKNKALFFMLLPGLVIMLINNYLPMFGLVFAFRKMDNYRQLFGSGWAGLSNFKYLFNSNTAWTITRNTIGYNFAFIIIGVIVPVIIAIGLNELRNKKAGKIYQSLFFIPYFLSWVVISYLTMGLLSNEFGAVNRLLTFFGQEKISWYIAPEYWPYIIIFVNTWKWTGYDTIVYLASIVGINQELFEAAAVDGASRFQQIWHITIPSLIPLAIVLVLIRLGRMFYTDMGLFFTVPRNMGPLQNVTNTIDTYVYRAFIQTGDIGLASAAGFYQAVLGLVVILSFNALVRKYDKDSAII
ncbi:ABC transporter permease [Cellulosilyticum sp. I15G10I2]|uniref:ABC transporter permease n=1 Tax=Cellulosilyticum sp. I15G10I2 TaxID=1892843 RepID=UPI00085C8316|nr:ABC transporter permease subunit [Cellulosilyticum sp. I15G10I2]